MQPVNHPKYFQQDGTLKFRVENVLYQLHEAPFLENSLFFDMALHDLSVKDVLRDKCVLVPGVTTKDFDLLLSVIYPNGSQPSASITAQEWSFIRAVAVKMGLPPQTIHSITAQNLDIQLDPGALEPTVAGLMMLKYRADEPGRAVNPQKPSIIPTTRPDFRKTIPNEDDYLTMDNLAMLSTLDQACVSGNSLSSLADLGVVPLFPALPLGSSNARSICDIDGVLYPKDIQGPNSQIKDQFKKGKPRYDREFLLQFMSVCNWEYNPLPQPISRPHATPFDQEATFRRGLGPSALPPVRKKKIVKTPTTPKAPLPAKMDGPVFERRVRLLLNKLTKENFGPISDQLIECANGSAVRGSGIPFAVISRLVFESATQDSVLSGVFALVCRRVMERVSPQIQDDDLRSVEGKPISGGRLFRKYLLNRCQEDFERGWQVKEAYVAAIKATQEKRADVGKKGEKGTQLYYSDEYYAAQKAKRRSLGLVKFMCELFMLQMLTERVMHECVKKLLVNVINPEEEDIEGLCKLFTAVGSTLDSNIKARAHTDIYFIRMKGLSQSMVLSSRLQFMLQDVIELRERNWLPRSQVEAPTTLATVQEQIAEEKCGQDHGYATQPGPDFASTPCASGGSIMRVSSMVGDLSQFGKISKSASMTFGPASVFNKKEGSKPNSVFRTASSPNLLSTPSLNVEPRVPIAPFGVGDTSQFGEVSALPASPRAPIRPKMDVGSLFKGLGTTPVHLAPNHTSP